MNDPRTQYSDTALILIAETTFAEFSDCQSNRELSYIVMKVIASAFENREREEYKAIFDNFVRLNRQNLERLFKRCAYLQGLPYVVEYLLFGQAESIIILERLANKKHMLVNAWRDSDLPDASLEELASSAGVILPALYC